jgi:fructose-1,6-bisphosphatase/inositol monophosphatase family enzyme
MVLEKELEVAVELTKKAGEITLEYRRNGFQTEIKEDNSPVTEADKAAEEFLVAELSKAFPDDGFLGEEGASSTGKSGRRWILDPIDGTKDYSRGIHSYSNLVALEAEGHVVVGVANHPVLGDTYWAAHGLGAWHNGKRMQVSKIAEPEKALIGFNGINHVHGKSFEDRLLPFLNRFWGLRCMGGIEPLLVAAGRMEAFFSVTGKPWDYAPSKIIIEEAGGEFFDFDGHSSIYNPTCIVTNPYIADEIRKFFNI